MNPDRMIVGLATVFGEPDRDDATVWHARDFADFTAAEYGVPMLFDHRVPIGTDEELGTWRAFAAVPADPPRPAGLLVIGAFGHSPFAEGMMAQVRDSLEPLTPRVWGLSVRAGDVSQRGDGSQRWLSEVSLTTRPAFDQALVLAVGPGAADVWELLTGHEPPIVKAVTSRTVRRLIGVRGGRPIYDEWQE